MKFEVLPEADGEAIASALWYDEQRIGLGDEFLIELEVAFTAIQSGPHRLPKLAGYSGSHNIRCQILKRFPFVVVFDCRADRVLVVAVAHTRRRPLYWLDRMN